MFPCFLKPGRRTGLPMFRQKIDRRGGTKNGRGSGILDANKDRQLGLPGPGTRRTGTANSNNGDDTVL